jgi:hypothetical protein
MTIKGVKISMLAMTGLNKFPCLFTFKRMQRIFEPRHDKTNIVGLRPPWIQTSLRIRAVTSGYMLFVYQLYYK